MKTQPIVIVGGGFAGLRAALDLDRILGHRLDTPIYLIDPASVHVYTPNLFEIMQAAEPRVSVIPYEEILTGTHIRHVKERVIRIDVVLKQVQTERRMISYADLILTPGSETTPLTGSNGVDRILSAHSFEDLLLLRERVHACFSLSQASNDQQCHNHFLIAGGGLSGVELAIGLQAYIQKQSGRYGLPAKGCHVTVTEEQPRILPTFKAGVSQAVARWMKQQGISIIVKSKLTLRGAQKLEGVSELPQKTVIWAHGRQVATFVAKTKGLRHDAKGRVLVHATLEALDASNVWVGGDSAAVDDSGWKASAIAHGRHIAKAVIARRENRMAPAYLGEARPAIIQLSTDNALLVRHKVISAGIQVAWLKQWDDLRYYISILPLPLAFARWASRGSKIEGVSTWNNTHQRPS